MVLITLAEIGAAMTIWSLKKTFGWVWWFMVGCPETEEQKHKQEIADIRNTLKEIADLEKERIRLESTKRYDERARERIEKRKAEIHDMHNGFRDRLSQSMVLLPPKHRENLEESIRLDRQNKQNKNYGLRRRHSDMGIK